MAVNLELLINSLLEDLRLERKQKKETEKFPFDLSSKINDMDEEIERVLIDLKIEEAKSKNLRTHYTAVTEWYNLRIANENLLGNKKAEVKLELQLQKYEDFLEEYLKIALKEKSTKEGALVFYALSNKEAEKYRKMSVPEYVEALLEHKFRHMRYETL